MATKALRLHRETETKRHGEIQPQARFGKGMLILAIAAFSLSIGPGAARAATRTVTSLNNSGGGTLRDTLAAAAAGDTIQFSVTGQIKLDSSLTITKNVTISGPGQAQLTVTRDDDGFALFVVNTGLTVSISDISITNAKGDEFETGGIQNAANLTLNRCIFSGNATGDAGDGGSIENTGVLTCTDCAFNNNKADDIGGAIANEPGGIVTVTSCTFTGNAASGEGGGAITNYGGAQSTINSCTFNSNTASAGGALMNFGYGGSSGVFTIRNSSFNNNNASGYGGAIYSQLGTVTVVNSTLANNSAKQNGGAVHNDDGNLTLRNCTLSKNSAAVGGGVSNNGAGNGYTANATVTTSTLADNSAPNGGGIYNSGTDSGEARVTLEDTILYSANTTPGANLINTGIGTSVISHGYNLSSDSAGGYLTAQGDQINMDPKLGPLQDNGGPTQTMALLQGSPAWDKGKSFTVTTDERGFQRPVDIPSIANAIGGDGSDIGAVEMDTIQTGPAFVVTTADDHDDGACSFADCTLREAIDGANATSGSTVSFKSQVTGVITLQATLGTLTVSNSVTIVGPGARTLAVSGNSTVGVFNFTSGTSVISGLTIQNGLAKGATGQAGMGGGMSNSAFLTVNDSMFIENSATGGNGLTEGSSGGKAQGGAIYSAGTLTLNRCTFSGNTATGGNTGTAITKGRGGNGGAGQGGAVFNEATYSLTMNSCSFYGNIARGGHGGNGSSGGNGGAGNGGAICNAGQMTATACTISSNAGGNSSGGTGAGGNGSPGPASGGITNISGGTATVRDTISANNTANGGAGADVDGAFTSGGYNLLGTGDHSTGFTATGDITGTDAAVLNAGVLGPPSNNGGPTDTFNLTSNSPALDAGKSFGLTTDQRGSTRIRDNPSIANATGGDGSDIGAIEIQNFGQLPTPTPTPAPTTTPGSTPTPTSPPNQTPTPTPTITPISTATPTPNPTPTPSSGSLGNISTRLQVGTGNNVLFAGFIIQGSGSKTVLIRSAGPSLTSFGLAGALSDPQLELHDANNTIGSNDDWQTTQLGGVITSDQVAAIQNSGAAPLDPAEPAIIATLPAGGYTAIVQGVGGTQGVATVEVYDLSPNNGATLANISTRGFIQTGDNVMIGGFIVVEQAANVIIRATGPSLIPFGINNALANPRIELHDANGALAGNDDWQTTQLGGIITSDQSAAIQDSGLAPGNAAESAIIATLAPGAYTAIAQGVDGGTGVGLVEVFALP
jgi:CSLREA domain-containing protein